jgi:hypothetical protein
VRSTSAASPKISLLGISSRTPSSANSKELGRRHLISRSVEVGEVDASGPVVGEPKSLDEYRGAFLS